MNKRIQLLAEQAGVQEDLVDNLKDEVEVLTYIARPQDMQKFAELIVQECASEYNKLINGEAVVLPKDREHAEALVRVGMFYLENNK